jgi:hypothetical protein
MGGSANVLSRLSFPPQTAAMPKTGHSIPPQQWARSANCGRTSNTRIAVVRSRYRRVPVPGADVLREREVFGTTAALQDRRFATYVA